MTTPPGAPTGPPPQPTEQSRWLTPGVAGIGTASFLALIVIAATHNATSSRTEATH